MRKKSKYWNERMETLSADEFHAVQSKALLNQLKYIEENSAFYKKKFFAANIDIRDIKSIDDLKYLPFTIKQELRDSLTKQKPLCLHAATGI